MDRRTYLTAFATATAAMAGCLGEGDTRPDDPTQTDDKTTPGEGGGQWGDQPSDTPSPTPDPNATPTPTETATATEASEISWGDLKAHRGTDYAGDPTLELRGTVTANIAFDQLFIHAYWYLEDGTRLSNYGLDMAENLEAGETFEYVIRYRNDGEHTAEAITDWRVFAEW